MAKKRNYINIKIVGIVKIYYVMLKMNRKLFSKKYKIKRMKILYIGHVRNKKVILNFHKMKMILIKNLEIYKLNQIFTLKYKKISNLQIFKKITL